MEDEGDEDGEGAEESSIRFSDLAKSMTTASRASQFTGVDSIFFLLLLLLYSIEEASGENFLRLI